jgi:hypothetical protein
MCHTKERQHFGRKIGEIRDLCPECSQNGGQSNGLNLQNIGDPPVFWARHSFGTEPTVDVRFHAWPFALPRWWA